MSLPRPCIHPSCGELVTGGSRCPDHKRTDRGKDKLAPSHPHLNTARWKRLSAKCRKLQPFCIDCGTDTSLSADHILPVSLFPQYAYSQDNVVTRCVRCNSRRGNHYTPEERDQVLAAIAARKNRQQRYVASINAEARNTHNPTSRNNAETSTAER